jgi:hypothetical protein
MTMIREIVSEDWSGDYCEPYENIACCPECESWNVKKYKDRHTDTNLVQCHDCQVLVEYAALKWVQVWEERREIPKKFR